MNADAATAVATAPRLPPAIVTPARATLLIAVLLVYAAALAGPFQFDDWWSIVDDARGHSLAAWWHAQPGIRPLLKLLNTLNWTASPTPAGFHALNLAIHAVATLALWRLLRAWAPRLAPRCRRPEAAAYLAALLFALHPAATEAVAYVSGRSIALSTVLVFVALDGWTRGSRLGTAAFVAAVLVRETAIVAPVAWLLLARCGGLDWRAATAPLRPLAVLLPLVALIAWLTPGYHSFFGWSLQTRGPGAQLLGQLEAHAYLLAGPLPGRLLDIDPDVRVPAAFAPHHAAVVAAFAATAIMAWHRRHAQPWIAFALGWYLLQLAPANSLLPRFDLANDRHLYAALPGPLLALALAVVAVPPRRLAIGLAGLLALASGLRTADRVADYRSEIALWSATVATSPAKARPWTNLGFARLEAGDVAGARHAFRCAVALDPAYAPATWNLAVLGPEGPVRARPACPAAR